MMKVKSGKLQNLGSNTSNGAAFNKHGGPQSYHNGVYAQAHGNNLDSEEEGLSDFKTTTL